MAATSTRSKLQEMIKEAEQVTVKRKVATKTEVKEEVANDEKFSDIDGNTFYKIVFDEKLTPEQKKEEITKALTYTLEEDKEKNKERLQELDLFKEYLQFERKRMAQEIIKLTDTGAFGELKAVYDELNSAVIDFEERMQPLTDIVEAVYQLRKAGGTMDVFRQIREDRESEIREIKFFAEKAEKMAEFQASIESMNKEIALFGEQRGFLGLNLGFGPVLQSAAEAIALKKIDLENASKDVVQLTSEIEQAQKVADERKLASGKWAEEKKKIRELLDISTEEHKERQKALVNSAQHFVNSTEARVGGVLNHLSGMNGQIEGLFNANFGMSNIYAILNESVEEAGKNNQSLHDTLKAPQLKEGQTAETAIQKMERESKKMAVEDHITELSTAELDTKVTLSDLTSQSSRIKSMKDSNREQITKTRQLHSAGVAGVADRLSTVLQAVSAAALNESSEAAKFAVTTMNEKTNFVAMQESLRQAMGVKDTKNDLVKAVEDLEAYGETLKASTRITREGLQDIRETLKDLEEKTRQVQKDVKESIAVTADLGKEEANADAGSKRETAKGPAAAKKASPFKFGTM